ncbi:MAG: hypothetical protein M3088_00785, partial [Actinomycetota bacterium]|nr:hypothetical protein [Actinomycetota bacterium]
MSSEEAVRELRRASGSQFDPAVVEAFEVGIAEQDQAPARVRPEPDPAAGRLFVPPVGAPDGDRGS